MKAYTATIYAKPGTLLLGGVRGEHDAQNYAQQ